MNNQRRAIFQDVPNYTKFVVALFVILVCFLVSSLLGIITALPFFNVEISELGEIASTENVALLKYLQVVQSVGSFVLPPFIIAYLFTKKSSVFLRLNIKPRSKSVFSVVLLMIMAIPAVNFFAEVNIKVLDSLFSQNNWMKQMEDVALKTTEIFLNSKSIGGLMLNVFIIAVIPAIGEELLFRGVLQKIFSEWFGNIHVGIIITAFLFSTIHLQFYGFLPRFLLGILFGYLFAWSKTMWLPVIAHFVNNAFAVIVSYFINANIIPDDVETVGMDTSTFFYAILSIIISVYLIYFVFKEEKRNL